MTQNAVDDRDILTLFSTPRLILAAGARFSMTRMIDRKMTGLFKQWLFEKINSELYFVIIVNKIFCKSLLLLTFDHDLANLI